MDFNRRYLNLSECLSWDATSHQYRFATVIFRHFRPKFVGTIFMGNQAGNPLKVVPNTYVATLSSKIATNAKMCTF